jgi:hypothetical protein
VFQDLGKVIGVSPPLPPAISVFKGLQDFWLTTVRPSKEERERRAAEKKAYIAMRANHSQANGNGYNHMNGVNGSTNGSANGVVTGSEEDADGEEE